MRREYRLNNFTDEVAAATLISGDNISVVITTKGCNNTQTMRSTLIVKRVRDKCA
jgi:hypothetical protein